MLFKSIKLKLVVLSFLTTFTGCLDGPKFFKQDNSATTTHSEGEPIAAQVLAETDGAVLCSKQHIESIHSDFFSLGRIFGILCRRSLSNYTVCQRILSNRHFVHTVWNSTTTHLPIFSDDLDGHRNS